MLRHAIVLLAITAAALCENRKQAFLDPFAALDKHISHSLAYHYLWPWSQLIQAAAALDAEDALEEPQIYTDVANYKITMRVKKFTPEELKVKVKNKILTVEGHHKEVGAEKPSMSNHFIQKFELPPGSRPEEVRAELRADGVLAIAVPKHEVPPPPPEREVPIVVMQPVTTTVKYEPSTEEVTTKKEEVTTKKEEVPSTVAPAIEQEVAEATTHIGKSRKKELKTTRRPMRDNEVGKLDGNALDYVLVDEAE